MIKVLNYANKIYPFNLGDHLEILVIEKGKEPIRSVHELRRD